MAIQNYQMLMQPLPQLLSLKMPTKLYEKLVTGKLMELSKKIN
jgi:hypothetical protein